MKSINPIYVFVLLMLLGAFTAINSYDLGTRAGTKEVVTTINGMTNYRVNTDPDKIKASTEAYKNIGCMVLLIGGIGLVTVIIKRN